MQAGLDGLKAKGHRLIYQTPRKLMGNRYAFLTKPADTCGVLTEVVAGAPLTVATTISRPTEASGRAVLLQKQELAHFAQGGARELAADGDKFGHFEDGQMLAAVGDDLFGLGLSAGLGE